MFVAGLDVHLKYGTVAVLDSNGTPQLEVEVPTRTPEALVTHLDRFRPLHVVVETCPCWPWLYDLLVPAGITFHLARAKALRAIATAPQKTDRVNARLLARMFLSGVLPEAYPRSADQRELLRLLRHRTTLVRWRTRLAGRVHSQLHQQRLQLPREQLLRQHTRALVTAEWAAVLTPEQLAIVTQHFALIDVLTPQLQALARCIDDAARGHPIAPLLATVPDIGPYRSLLLATELAPLMRFATVARRSRRSRVACAAPRRVRSRRPTNSGKAGAAGASPAWPPPASCCGFSLRCGDARNPGARLHEWRDETDECHAYHVARRPVRVIAPSDSNSPIMGARRPRIGV
jgi:transposase